LNTFLFIINKITQQVFRLVYLYKQTACGGINKLHVVCTKKLVLGTIILLWTNINKIKHYNINTNMVKLTIGTVFL